MENKKYVVGDKIEKTVVTMVTSVKYIIKYLKIQSQETCQQCSEQNIIKYKVIYPAWDWPDLLCSNCFWKLRSGSTHSKWIPLEEK